MCTTSPLAIPAAQAEHVIQPDHVADDPGREPMLVTGDGPVGSSRQFPAQLRVEQALRENARSPPPYVRFVPERS